MRQNTQYGSASYARTRHADPRIIIQIQRALGDAHTIVNVGAGTGSYEPFDRVVLAIDPSVVMLEQRSDEAAPAILGCAETLPMLDQSIDAALAVLTIHHWRDPQRGLREMRRVARKRVVLLTWDPAAPVHFWLTDYFPGMAADTSRFPSLDELTSWLGTPEISDVPVPFDCRDGFAAAFWCRPEAYLDPVVRSGMSAFASLPEADVKAGLAALQSDIATGRWARRYGATFAPRDSLDLGYRLLVWERQTSQRARH